jgi:hypothetical protein
LHRKCKKLLKLKSGKNNNFKKKRMLSLKKINRNKENINNKNNYKNKHKNKGIK